MQALKGKSYEARSTDRQVLGQGGNRISDVCGHVAQGAAGGVGGPLPDPNADVRLGGHRNEGGKHVDGVCCCALQRHGG